jgi:hypothetical protein
VSSVPSNDGPPDVYVAGWDISGPLFRAVYWKNGVETVLDSGSYGARAEGIAVANGNIYVVGFEGSGSGNDVAVVWTNGIPTPLADDSHVSVAWAIALSGGDVYIAGTDSPSATSPSAAVYWKNGVETTLAVSGLAANSTATGAFANSIALDNNNNVYVGGSVYLNSEIAPNSYFDTSVASYWENGTLSLLGSPLTFSESYGIAVAGGDVFVAGDLCAIPAAGANPQPGCSVATYWENGKPIMQEPASQSTYSGIALSNSNLYLPDNVVASGAQSSGNLAELSVNGTLQALSSSTPAAANCVFVYNTDVYIGGAANDTAGYWDNGDLKALPDSGSQSTVTAIDVVPAGTL